MVVQPYDAAHKVFDDTRDERRVHEQKVVLIKAGNYSQYLTTKTEKRKVGRGRKMKMVYE